MAGKKSRKTDSSKKGNKKGASGKTANVSDFRSQKEMNKAAGIRRNPAGSHARDAIAAVILIAVSIFTLIALLTEEAGKAGMILSMLLKGMLGDIAYVLPFYFLIYSALMLVQKVAHMNSRTIGFTVIMICDLTMLNSIRFEAIKNSTPLFAYIKNMFLAGSTGDSAGVIGMLLGRLVYALVAVPGMVLIGVVVLIICLILVGDTRVSQFFDHLRIKKNQKKIDALPEKTETGTFSATKDTLEMDLENLTESRSGKSRKKKNPKKEKEDSGPVIIEDPSVRGRKGAAAEDSEEDEEDRGLQGGESRIRQLWNAAGSRGIQSFLSGFSAKKSEDDTLLMNKKQILGYLESENLFGSSEEDNFRTALQEDDDWGEIEIPSGWGRSFQERESGRERQGDRVQDVSFREPEPEASSIKESDLDEFDKFLWSELQQGTANEELYQDDPAEESFAAFPGASDRDETDDDFEIPFQTEGRNSSGKMSSEVSDSADALAGPAGKAISRASRKAAVAAEAAGSLEEVNKAVETAAAKPEKVYYLPPLTLLNQPPQKAGALGKAELREKAAVLEKVFRDFGVDATVINVNRGPSITRYEIQPATGVKVSSIVRLSDDIALNLRAKSLRIEAPIPGKAAIGIEVQNEASDLVCVREMIESKEFREASSKISFAVGMDIGGNCVIADLKKMPHMLIAGSTGSGKSVCINSILMSILYHSTPDEVKMILIDPKVVELGNYNGIPHMLIPVVTDPAKAAAALMWAVQEMEARYKKFAKEQVKNLAGFNKKMKNDGREGEVMPQIVIIIDELADLMMAAAKQVEESICRLAQLARAAGMHMIVATQRPSVDVVTGLIKANVPSRIAFAVSSQVDSRTILDRAGAENLVGNGDMLFSPLGSSHPQRLQGPFVTDEEVAAVIDFWKAQAGDDQTPEQMQQQVMKEINTVTTDFGGSSESEDDLYQDAVKLVVDSGHASASMLQRRFRIGYNRAGRLIDEMEARGIIGPSEGSRPRKVLISKEEYEAEDLMPEEDDSDWSELPEYMAPQEEEV